MTMFVKVVRVPSTVTEVALEDGATVADALAAASLTTQPNEALTVNAQPATPDTVLSDGDRVVLAMAAKSAS